MKKLVKILALALGLGLLAAGLGTITSSPAPAAAATPVNIAAVSVASVPVSGTVNVGNTPSVHVTNTPTVNFAAGSQVNVSNPLDSQRNPKPLATLEATQPYEDRCTGGFGGNNSASCNFLTIPAGKRLIIQEVDIFMDLPTGVQPEQVWVVPNPSSVNPVPHGFVATQVSTGFALHQETRLYAGQNQTPSCNIAITAPEVSGFGCSLSGFLVDVP
jgi:hypothetical protein